MRLDSAVMQRKEEITFLKSLFPTTAAHGFMLLQGEFVVMLTSKVRVVRSHMEESCEAACAARRSHYKHASAELSLTQLLWPL